jgi:hypothetical protein
MQVEFTANSFDTYDENPEYHHVQFRFMITIEEANHLIKILKSIDDYDAKHTALRFSQFVKAFGPMAIKEQMAIDKENAQAQAQVTEA